jgi:predicted secreted hydrolase
MRIERSLSRYARSRIIPISVVLMHLVTEASAQRPALPGYQFEFPKDHFDHPDFATEWWYFTGNLSDDSGRPFGFELTFFRQAISRTEAPAKRETSVWKVDQLYLAHFAVSDLQGREFFHAQRLNRAGPELAGISEKQGRYWNGNWQVRWVDATRKAELQAVTTEVALRLTLEPQKGPVIHGHHGISQKGPEPGNASHYISFTRLVTNGILTWKGKSYSLHGLAWMDHEFFSHQLDVSQAGWDWFSVQLENNEEFMFYRLRNKSGAADPYSSGTFVDRSGGSHFLEGHDFALEQTGAKWTSATTKATYPLGWRLTVPSLGVDLIETTPLDGQELDARGGTGPSYWEGAVRFAGVRDGRPVKGSGYLEMTGYDQVLFFGQR